MHQTPTRTRTRATLFATLLLGVSATLTSSTAFARPKPSLATAAGSGRLIIRLINAETGDPMSHQNVQIEWDADAEESLVYVGGKGRGTMDVLDGSANFTMKPGTKDYGDANRTADVWTIRPDQVKGHVVVTLHGFGYLAVYFQQPTGIASVATALIGLLLLYGLFFPSTPEQAAEDDDTARQPGAQPALA